MKPEWCALCLVGHSSMIASLKLFQGDGTYRLIAPDEGHLVREAAGVQRVLSVTGQDINLAMTTYAGTPVCSWHLDEEIGRRRLCR